jgi:uncharacterized membrane protein YphA (DoxX/SURF4 family)
MKALSLTLRLIVAAILLQTLYFKFSGAPESIYIFTTMGMEPAGRYGTGVVELLASVLLFVPRARTVGAALAVGTMAGALGGHLTKLGIEVQGDHGLLFGLALTVLLCSLGILAIHRKEIPIVGARL